MRTNQDRRTRIADEIRAELARQRMSQAVLSAKTGIKTSTLHSRLQGVRPFWLHELEAIAVALNVRLSELIARSDAPDEVA